MLKPSGDVDKQSVATCNGREIWAGPRAGCHFLNYLAHFFRRYLAYLVFFEPERDAGF